MPQRTIRFSETTLQQIQRAAKQKGFASIAAVIRHAVDQELTGSDGVEQRIAATLDRIQTDLSGMQRVQQTLFAFVDTLAKALLTGLAEQSPPSDIRDYHCRAPADRSYGLRTVRSRSLPAGDSRN